MKKTYKFLSKKKNCFHNLEECFSDSESIYSVVFAPFYGNIRPINQGSFYFSCFTISFSLFRFRYFVFTISFLSFLLYHSVFAISFETCKKFLIFD